MSAPPKPVRKVLVVDDDEQYLKVTARVLRTAGYDVVTRSNVIGTSAAVVSERPDMVLIDLDMPGLDGDRLAVLIQHSVAKTPLLVLYSGMNQRTLVERGRACGANATISKQELPEQFLRHMDSIFRARS
jgi:CheY-like chemotaxis protein